MKDCEVEDRVLIFLSDMRVVFEDLLVCVQTDGKTARRIGLAR